MLSARYISTLDLDTTLTHIFIFQLSAIKSCSVGAALVTVLFFSCSVGKFCLVHQDDLVTNTLQLKKTYHVKNVKKQFDDVYLAINSTVLKESKKPIQNSERFLGFIIRIMNILFSIFSFEDNEIEDLLKKVKDTNLDIATRPSKRVKLEEPSAESAFISLSTFLTTPHFKTKKSFVQVFYLILIY